MTNYTVSRIINTTTKGGERLDSALRLISRRQNISNIKYAMCQTDKPGTLICKVQLDINILPDSKVDLQSWFDSIVRKWMIGFQVFELDNVKVKKCGG